MTTYIYIEKKLKNHNLRLPGRKKYKIRVIIQKKYQSMI